MKSLVRRSNQPTTFFNAFVDNFFNDEFPSTKPTSFFKWNTPAVNVKENDEGFDLELALPGIDKEDIKLEVKENLLTISSEKETNNEVKEEKYVRREFGFAAFKRLFTIPKNVNRDKIEANYKDGILNVNLPKHEKEIITAKHIEIK